MAKKDKKEEILETEENLDNIEKQEEAVSEEAKDEAAETEKEKTEEKAEEGKTEEEGGKILAELESLKSSNMRITAEFQNYRKRVEKEKADIYKFANEKLIVDLLPVVDDFERAIESFSSMEGNEGFVSGIEMIKKNLDEFMKKNNVQAVEAVGKAFDPNLHHAVMSEETGEHEEETVIAEFQKGYTLNGKIIRPAMVKVSK